MVLQTDWRDEVVVEQTLKTLTIDVGESTTADAQDNALDTVHHTITDGTVTNSANILTSNGITETGDAIGDTLNAILVKLNGTAVDLDLFTSITKDDTTQINYTSKITFFLE